MKFMLYPDFIQVPKGTPFIELDGSDILKRFDKAINDNNDFFYETLDSPTDIAEEQDVPVSAAGAPTGEVSDDLFDTIGCRDGVFDDERSFLVLDTLDARLGYLGGIVDMLGLADYSEADKERAMKAVIGMIYSPVPIVKELTTQLGGEVSDKPFTF